MPDLKHSDEAQANRAFAVSDWTLALNAAEKWQELEPFSARPAIFGSFVASILSHSIDRGLAIARQGLKSNPQDFTLLNNYVVLCCYGGNLVEAKQGFVKLSELAHSGSFHVTRLATGGLISFREGAFDAGVQSYTSAINEALALRDPILALRAYCFLAREVSLLDAGMAERFSKNIRDTISALERRGIKIPAEVNILLGQIDEARGVAVQLEWGDLSKFTLSDRIQ